MQFIGGLVYLLHGEDADGWLQREQTHSAAVSPRIRMQRIISQYDLRMSPSSQAIAAVARGAPVGESVELSDHTLED
eukprot:gene12458-biopygen568